MAFETAIRALKGINPDKKILLITHKDHDGVVSADTISRALKSRNVFIDKVVLGDPLIIRKMKDEIINEKYDYFLSFDIEQSQMFKELSEIKNKLSDLKMIIIDHHQPTLNLNNWKDDGEILHINPHFTPSIVPFPDPSNYCACKITYDIVNSFSDIGDRSPFIAAGIIGDFSENAWPEFMGEVYKKYPREEILKLADVLSVFSHGGSDPYITYLALQESDTFGEILEGKTRYSDQIMREYSDLVQERNSIASRFDNEADIDRETKLCIFQIDSKKFLASEVANIISRRMPSYTHVVIQIHDGTAKAKARNQFGTVDVAKMLRTITPVVGGDAGGHSKASGSEFPTEKIDEYIELIKKYVEEHNNQYNTPKSGNQYNNLQIR